MEDFPDLSAFLEHISLVMERSRRRRRRKGQHHDAARGQGVGVRNRLSSRLGRGACFRTSARSTSLGVPGSRRSGGLAYVGITRAKRRAKIYFATNRRIHGLWQTTIPSRFLDELPEAHVEVVEAANGNAYGGYAQSRFANMDQFVSPYATPGWQRAQRRQGGTGPQGGTADFGQRSARRGPLQIEGELVAKSSVSSGLAKGARVFHQKFGNGSVAAVGWQQADRRLRQSRSEDGARELSAGDLGRTPSSIA